MSIQSPDLKSRSYKEEEAELLSKFSSATREEFQKQQKAGEANLQLVDAWNEHLKAATPEETAAAYHDYMLHRSVTNTDSWRQALLESLSANSMNLARFRFPKELTHGTISKRKMHFTHEQAISIISSSIEITQRNHIRSVTTSLSAQPKSILKQLSEAIRVPDAVLAEQLRDSNSRSSEPVKKLIKRLCPIDSERNTSKSTPSKTKQAVIEAIFQLRLRMETRPGLWVIVEREKALTWPEFNHQLFPYFREISDLLGSLKASAQAGDDIEESRKCALTILKCGAHNLKLLRQGKVLTRSLSDVRAGLPAGATVNAVSPYWSLNLPEWQRDMFDQNGAAQIDAVEHAEKLMLEKLEKEIDALDNFAPAGQSAKHAEVLIAPDNASRPNKKWIKSAAQALTKSDLEELLSELKEFKPFNVFTNEVMSITEDGGSSNLGSWYLETSKWHGKIWAAHLAGNKAAQVLYDVARRCYAKIPGVGVTNEKLGNASVVSLALIQDGSGIPFLSRLQTRLPQPKIRKMIGRELTRAADAIGLTKHELEEISVTDYGLVDAACAIKIEDDSALISVETDKAVLNWQTSTGKITKSIPSSVKTDYPDKVKEARDLAKTIDAELVTQKRRLERFYLSDLSWPYDLWRRRYADHGLMAILTRALLWRLEKDGVSNTVLPIDGECVTVDGQPIDTDGTIVRLWHPLDVTPEEVEEWRNELTKRGIKQPFRQVWRETFVLTDAERDTATYTNRFAAHILKQHQMIALAHSNDWQCTHRVGYDTASDEPSHLRIPDFDLQAEYWTSAAGKDSPTSDSGAYLYIVTDRLKFHQLDAKAKYGRGSEVLLVDVPDRVFSEVLRACDLFVAVSSIGLDPEWSDKGQDANHPSNWQEEADRYWSWSQNAPLSTSAEVRRAMLEKLIPGLKKGNVFQLEGNQLNIAGKKHDYRIHLGSGGVQVANTNRHICIVPSQAKMKGLPLPFDGDAILSLIVSKALLLANDDKIKDPVILAQMPD